ncbi:NUDIX domain-containing protein [Pseudactinotalea sp. HY160]|uniref:NUDIX hydrolase n=1 Tax=Pseudactinotalea sp. HY160 TaxID=2654490 RepID=UPI00128DF2BF|nr:CoA pyrophosphatase [Pseudactinotalea sp. HY160]MPV51097.1 NUDIX domain-containing protein [Pseudactinotalea sp. HY160]
MTAGPAMPENPSTVGEAGSRTWRADLDSLVGRYRAGDLPGLEGPHRYDPAEARGFRRAAVLALFTPSAAPPGSGIDLFLVQRSPHLLHHPGQIALPGGGIDPGESILEAAVREGEEETGVPAAGIEIVGRLGTVTVPVSDNIVTPVVGWCDDPGHLPHTDTAEVLEPLRVPVTALLDPANRATITFMGHRSAGFRAPTGWVWGFTGNLLDYVFDQLGWTVPWDRAVTRRLTLDEARGRGLT